MTQLVLVGTSHHHAPVELRERVAFDRDQAHARAERLGRAVCLSTCNRTELYLETEDADAAERAAVEALSELEPALYRLRDHAAALHLFRVAAGLDSLVPGEGEILGQVRAAHDAGTPGPLLDRVFRHALHAGRKVRAQTAIGESPASVSAAAAALAAQVFGDLRGRRVLLLGAGRVAELAAGNLVSRHADIAFVANRTMAKARGVAHRFDAEPIALADVTTALGNVDVVISATGSPEAVVRAADVPARRSSPLFFIDIAVPRDVDAAVQGLDGCYLYDVDDLQAVVEKTLAGRRDAASRAEALVAEEAERFREWQASLDVVPAIASLRARAEEIRASELAKLGGLSDRERRAVESVTAQIVNKLLHLPTVRLKQAAAAADGVVYAEAVRHLFGLGEDER